MLPAEVKELLEDVEMSTKKITAREIVLFDRHSTKEEIDELRRLIPLLSKAVVDDNTEACIRLTNTVSKIVKQRTDGKDDHKRFKD